MKSLELSQLFIYPIKSLGGISLSSARVFPKGLEHDRRWMLVDETGTCMTQRVYPAMALFRLAIGESLMVMFKNQSITIPLRSVPTAGIPVKIWEDTVVAHEVSTQHSAWFSDLLNVKCKLVHFPENNPRPVEAAYKVSDDHVSLADAYPFLLIGQSSLNDLNQRLDAPVPMNRFRPNFVVSGSEPYEEDNWKNFSIGKNQFVAVKPCARCVLTTVDQETGEKGAEPLRTLSSYRRQNNKVLFGQNVIGISHSVVNVGDPITLS